MKFGGIVTINQNFYLNFHAVLKICFWIQTRGIESLSKNEWKLDLKDWK